ncbi:MAG: hypothetical protein C0625_04575 [Arcobacter sp.]|nr:MAG: hypothetical protein C0625_04575 [Arcobacter sp.]
MKDIINYIKVSDNIATSGQPTKEQFEKISKNGYEIVINLAVAQSEGKIENEDDIVTTLGMNYIHIPVEFLEPTTKNLKDFLEILSSLSHKKVWVHCIMNYRVSAFMYVYHKYILNTPFENIDMKVFEEWSPDESWQKIMKTPPEDLDI